MRELIFLASKISPSHLSTPHAASEVTDQRRNVFRSLMDPDKKLNGA